ncbi:hypothetical protein H2201_001662 [Coniosporium apollinis]|uniref:ferric-chelate reductase (NADPH) n=1 Tax=Coniosporium apollinis TaxID=61459 RepID=A0ABQ9P1K6_9PEZI|nr:hypothetical protein H2201_001662 [Coniosporium apollinis]
MRWALLAVVASTASAAGPAGAPTGPTEADFENVHFSRIICWTWVACVGSLVIYQIIVRSVRYVRTITCLNNDTQRFFARPRPTHALLKRDFIDAPLLRMRHHREFKLSAALNVGTLPSRIQTLYLAGYLAMNVAFCVLSIDWSGVEKSVASELRNRTGVLAVMNMLPLFLLAGRNNPLIKWCGISFDTFNLLHRWIGRVVVLEALAHTLAWMVSKVHQVGWSGVATAVTHSQLIMTGTIGTLAFLALLFQSPSVLRHAFYETFLHVHIALAGLAVGAVWIHLKTLPQQRILMGVIALWAMERSLRLARIIIRNVGRGGTKVDVEVLPGDALRVTVRMARPWKFHPGQHAYLYLPTLGWWTSHPFSLAWSEEEQEGLTSEKGLVVHNQDILEVKKSSMSMIIRRRTGFTDKLYQKADLNSSGKFTTSALIEGPYGHQSLSSYGTVILFAAGVGITHQVPHLRHLVAGFDNGTVAARRVTLIWMIQSREHLEWTSSWMNSILCMPRRREVLKILIFVTRPRSPTEIESPSGNVKMFAGRPNVRALVEQELEHGVGAAVVSVCGTGSLADDVRRAVRGSQGRWNVDLCEESFSW